MASVIPEVLHDIYSNSSYLSEGLRPLPPAPKLEDPMIGRFDDPMDDTADHLSAIGGSRACLLKSILAAACGLGPYIGGPLRCQGLSLGPGLGRGRQNALDCILARAGALFY